MHKNWLADWPETKELTTARTLLLIHLSLSLSPFPLSLCCPQCSRWWWCWQSKLLEALDRSLFNLFWPRLLFFFPFLSLPFFCLFPTLTNSTRPLFPSFLLFLLLLLHFFGLQNVFSRNWYKHPNPSWDSIYLVKLYIREKRGENPRYYRWKTSVGEMNDNITNSSATILAQKKLSNISVLTFRNIGTIEEGSSNFFGAKYTGIFVIYPGRVLFYSHPARCDTLSFKFKILSNEWI